jgi:hypothetical protein
MWTNKRALSNIRVCTKTLVPALRFLCGVTGLGFCPVDNTPRTTFQYQIVILFMDSITATAVVAVILSLILAFAVTRSDKEKTRATPLTLRISNIPRSISEGELQDILIDLAGEINASPGVADHDRPELLAWSCARSGHSERSFVATATFRVPPAPIQLESAIKRTIGVDSGSTQLIRVDLDFFGLTPLADPQDPAVE